MQTPAIANGSAETETETEIIPSLSLSALLSQRDAVLERLRDVQVAVQEIEQLAERIGFADADLSHTRSKFLLPISDGRYAHLRFTAEDWLVQATANVDAALWDLLLHRSGLRTFMDKAAREQWDEEIEKNRSPPLTAENIRATFRQLHSARADFFERGVLSVFRALSWDYKSNLPQRFGTRVILRYLVSDHGFPSHGTCDHLDDLIRAFHLLDGRPEPDHRQGVARRLGARATGEDLTDDYVRIRTFKNGNGHVYLLRSDLVAALNRILAKHHPNALPPRSP